MVSQMIVKSHICDKINDYMSIDVVKQVFWVMKQYNISLSWQ